MTHTPPLFEIKTDQNPLESEQERAIKALIEEIREKGGLNAARTALAATALSLARNIDAGNRKGRAIANEAAQLAAIIDRLTEEEQAGTKALPPEITALTNALAYNAHTSQTEVLHASHRPA